MLASERLPIFPSKGNQRYLMQRLQGARKGYMLLKKKADALNFRFRLICTNLESTRDNVNELLRAAALSLAEVKYVAGDIGPVVMEKVDVARITVEHSTENIAGVTLLKFKACDNDHDTYKYLCLARGGQQLALCKKAYKKAIDSLTELSTIYLGIRTLAESVRSNQKRVLVMEQIIIPRVELTLSYINSELEEIDREDFFRIKKIKTKKRQEDEEDGLQEKMEPPTRICNTLDELSET
ncbi:V-type proton ATPase subunit D 1 [Cephus cinctus]|uniref:V-type proton ATPase subunit D 1 n=1 Tax=Cephus cinctus TaxID=211228 RepID=A0AAJ7RQT5_CEPCN|nr:V-type proton ATPase subunit D 1 [Cephus cinctus]